MPAFEAVSEALTPTCPLCAATDGAAISFEGALHCVTPEQQANKQQANKQQTGGMQAGGPDLRADILQGRFPTATCSACGHGFGPEPAFTYLDLARGQWIAALPARCLQDHLAITADQQLAFDQSYGNPEVATAAGPELQPRLVFGWAALREKLLLQEIGFDDVFWEVTKLGLLPDTRLSDQRRGGTAGSARGEELRLVGRQGAMLQLAWISSDPAAQAQGFEIPAARYEDIVAQPARWAAMQALLGANIFVDVQKLFVGGAEEATRSRAKNQAKNQARN